MASVAPRHIQPVAAWLARRHVRPGGPPFFNNVLIGDAQLDIDVGFPIASALEGEGDVRPGRFPEGLYAVLRHLGPYDELKDAHGRLYAWGREHGVRFQGLDRSQGTECLARFESYLSDPGLEEDPSRLQTEIAFLVERAERRR